MSPMAPGDVGALTTIRTVGGVVPSDLLTRVVVGTDLPGLTGDDYRLELGVSPREAANRAWSVLHGAWTAYREVMAARPEGDRATALTRDKWLGVLLRELGFGRVPPTPAGGLQADGRAFPVSHHWENMPIHLLGWGVDLDRKTKGVAGAAERAPHAMVQELLNRAGEYLWAFLANATTLRLLRDSSTLVGQSYVEFDLQAMFDGEVFSDFVVLYLLCHQSRFEILADGTGPADCWLERWRAHAVESGVRALGALRIGVRKAIEALGTGFFRHPDNATLRARLDPGGDLTVADYHRALLRLAYRLLFCFVAEDRDLLLAPEADAVARQRYHDWFSTARLRRIATRRRGTRHADLWDGLSLILDGLGRDGGRPELGLPALGGLFEPGPEDVVAGCRLDNEALLTAVRHLTVIQPAGGGPKRVVDYRHLGAEELGGIYESLLEFVPRHDAATRTFTLEILVGNERKTSGSYYTPTPLIDSLLDTALDPLLDEAEKSDDPKSALLALTVCDTACGSGHFLVAAARRIGARLAPYYVDDEQGGIPNPQAPIHDAVSRCIYGVDVNPLAAELAKVSLWLEALQAGQPLSFLDSHIKVGNALLGTTPALLAQGIPDEAFKALEGDDSKTVSALKRRNKTEREGQGDLFAAAGIRVDNQGLAEAARAVDATLADVAEARRRQRELDASPDLRRARLLADAWCAAFVIAKRPGGPELTHAVLEGWQTGDLDRIATHPAYEEVQRIARRFRFFHWHVEFPHLFPATTTPDGPGWTGGVSCILGNPPWERIKLQEQEFFGSRDPEIAGAPNAAARKQLISDLKERNPALLAEFRTALRDADGESHFIRKSGRYPLCGRGDVNTYAVFAETARTLLDPRGRAGVILPTGIATDATTQYFFRSIVERRALASMWSLAEVRKHFLETDDRRSFSLLTLTGDAAPADRAEFAFGLASVSQLSSTEHRFTMTSEEIKLLNPNTGTCPIFLTRRDAEIAISVYEKTPVLIRRRESSYNHWGLAFSTMFHMANDSGRFRTSGELADSGWRLDGNRFRRNDEVMMPLYEAKMIHHFDHRWGTYEGQTQSQANQGILPRLTSNQRDDPTQVTLPRYWLSEEEVQESGCDATLGWFLGFRDGCRSTDERTLINAAFPIAAVGHTLPLVTIRERPWLLSAIMSSLVFDYFARQKVGGSHMTFFIVEQLPALPPEAFESRCLWDASLLVGGWMEPRIVELAWTAWDMEPFARDLGESGPPFHWDDDRRATLRAELDAAFFLLYGLDRDATAHVLSTFQVLNRNDEGRTQTLVMECYDRMTKAIAGGDPFRSTLEPPPGHGPRHPPR